MTITHSDGWYRATYLGHTFASSGVHTLEDAIWALAKKYGERIDRKDIREACRAAREGRG